MDNNGKWMGWKTNCKKEHAAAHGSINQCQIYEQWHGSVPLTEFIKPQIRSHCAPLFRPQAAETNFGKILEVIWETTGADFQFSRRHNFCFISNFNSLLWVLLIQSKMLCGRPPQYAPAPASWYFCNRQTMANLLQPVALYDRILSLLNYVKI